MLQIQLLGGFQIIDGDTPVSGLSKLRMQSFLSYLLLHAHMPQSRAHLAYTFWPDSSDSQARTNLRHELLQLRRTLPRTQNYLRIEQQTIQWHPEAEYLLDVDDFVTTLAKTQSATDTRQRIELLQRATGFYQGELLPGHYEEWILAKREELAQQYTQALAQLVSLYIDERNYTDAIQTARHLLRSDPLDEASYYLLMEVYAHQNDRARALHTYHACATILEQELGVAPSPQVERLYEQLSHAESTEVTKQSVEISESAHFIGRTREWQTLLEAWRRASQGRLHLVLIEGEAGIGKTRLGEELLKWVNRQGIPTARVRSYAAEGSLAYAPIIDWLRSDAIYASLADLEPEWQAEIARLLPELLTINPKLPRPEALTERWQRQRLFEALARAIALDAQPNLLLIDDLQWCDQETLEWLRYLLRFDLAARLLLVGTARPEEIHAAHPLRALVNELGRRGQLTTVSLTPLDTHETKDLGTQISGNSLSHQEIAALYSASEGNPLFVVEMVRAGYHKQDSGNEIEAVMSPCDLELPPKVFAVIQSRLAQLSPPAYKLAGLAATIGCSFDFELLIMASGDDEDVVANGLDELWRRRIIHERGINRYDFSHDRIRDVAYAEISPIQKRMMHRHLATALQQQYTENLELDGVSGQIAIHFENAGLVKEALFWHQRAAETAQQVFAYAESLFHERAGLALLDTLPEDAARTAQKVDLLLSIDGSVNAIYGIAYAEREQILLQTCELGARMDDRRRLSKALGRLAFFYRTRGELRKAEQSVQEYLLATQQIHNLAHQVDAFHLKGQIALAVGDFARVRHFYEQGLLAIAESNIPREDANIIAFGPNRWLAVTYWILGFPKQAQAFLHEPENRQNPSHINIRAFFASIVYYNMKSAQLLAPEVEMLVSIGNKYDLSLAQLDGMVFRGWELAYLGKFEEGIALIEQGVDGYRKVGHITFLTYRLAMLCEMHLMADQLAEAQTVLDEAFAISQEKGERFWDVELHRLQGDLHLAHGNAHAAEESYQHAIEVAQLQHAKSLELRATIALCHAVLRYGTGQRQSKTEQALRSLSELYDWFTEGFDTHDLQAAKELLDHLH